MRRFLARPSFSGRSLLDIEELESRAQPAGLHLGALAQADLGPGHGVGPAAIPPGWLDATPAAAALEAASHGFGFTRPGAGSLWPDGASAPPAFGSTLPVQVTIVIVFHSEAAADPPVATLVLGEPADVPATAPPATTPSVSRPAVDTDDTPTIEPPTAGPTDAGPTDAGTTTAGTGTAGGITTSPSLTRSGRESAARASEPATRDAAEARLVSVATPIVLISPDATATPGRPAAVPVVVAVDDRSAEAPGARATAPLPRFTPTVVDYITGSAGDEAAGSPRAAEPGADGARPKDALPVEVAPPPHEPGKSEAPVAPAETVPGAADAAAPDAGGVVAELFAVILPEELGSRWTWLAAAAGVTAAGYWAVRRYLRKVARKVLARKLPAPLGAVTAVETA